MCVLVGLLSVSGGCAQCRYMCACLWDDLVCAVGVHSSGTRVCVLVEARVQPWVLSLGSAAFFSLWLHLSLAWNLPKMLN